MKVVLFCGGLGTRMRAYSETIPKPLAEVGGRPILWHLMKYYASYGHKDFILCLGYRGDLIREYFLNYNPYLSTNFVMTDGGQTLTPSENDIDDWRISFVDTGLHSNLAQRLVAVRDYIGDDEYFLANYSDQLSDLPLDEYISDGKSRGSVANLISVKPHHSVHNVEADDAGYVLVIKPIEDAEFYINGGYFLLRNDIFDYIEDGEELVEEPFARLSAKRLLWTKHYDGFWLAMDTFKDKIVFDRMDDSGDRPWMRLSHNCGRTADD